MSIKTSIALQEALTKPHPSGAWAYIRISAEQHEKSHYADSQYSAIREYIAKNEMVDVNFIEEQCSAVKPILYSRLKDAPADSGMQQASYRPLLFQFLSVVSHTPDYKGGNFIVWSLDRLAVAVLEQEVILEMLRARKIKIHILAKHNGDTGLASGGHTREPIRNGMRHALQMFSLYQKESSSLFEEQGILATVPQSKSVIGGRPPYGFRSVKNRTGVDLVIHDEEADIVRFIFDMHKRFRGSPTDISKAIVANKEMFDVDDFPSYKVSRILSRESVYKGKFENRLGTIEERQELRILPEDSVYDH